MPAACRAAAIAPWSSRRGRQGATRAPCPARVRTAPTWCRAGIRPATTPLRTPASSPRRASAVASSINDSGPHEYPVRLQRRRRRAQKLCRGSELTRGEPHVGQQHLADRAARLLQLGEIGVLLGHLRSAPVEVVRDQQGGGLRQAHGEPQQPWMFGGEGPRGHRFHVGEPTHPCSAQRRRAGRPRDRRVVGRRARPTPRRRSAGPASGCPRSLRRWPSARRSWSARPVR